MGHLFQSYSKATVPNYKGPLEVKVGIYINGISYISDVDMKFELNFYFRQSWNDDRLQFDNETVLSWNDSAIALDDVPESILLTTEHVKGSVFVPDVFFRSVCRKHRTTLQKNVSSSNKKIFGQDQ